MFRENAVLRPMLNWTLWAHSPTIHVQLGAFSGAEIKQTRTFPCPFHRLRHHRQAQIVVCVLEFVSAVLKFADEWPYRLPS